MQFFRPTEIRLVVLSYTGSQIVAWDIDLFQYGYQGNVGHAVVPVTCFPKLVYGKVINQYMMPYKLPLL